AGFWGGVGQLDGRISVATQCPRRREGRKLGERAVRWLLQTRRPPFDIQATVGFFADGVRAVGASLPRLLSGRDLVTFNERREAGPGPRGAADPARRGAALVPAPSAVCTRHRAAPP